MDSARVREQARDLVATDGLRLFTRWNMVPDPLGTVLIVHGLGEHSGRYQFVVEQLCQAGFSVVRFDLRGHGQSQGLRGFARSYDQLLDDISTLLNEIRLQPPGRFAERCYQNRPVDTLVHGERSYQKSPVYLYGHSLGGGLTANWCLRRSPEEYGVRKVVLSAPWLRLKAKPPAWQVFLIQNTAAMWPWFTIPSRFHDRDLTSDPVVLESIRHDRLMHHRITVKLAIDCYHAGLWALENAGDFPIPAFCLHGTSDNVTSPEATREFCEAAPDAELRLLPDLLHEPHQAPEREDVIDSVCQWLGGSPSVQQKSP